MQLEDALPPRSRFSSYYPLPKTIYKLISVSLINNAKTERSSGTDERNDHGIAPDRRKEPWYCANRAIKRGP